MSGYFKRSVWVAISLLGYLAIAQVVQAASFDCAKASTNIEKMICADTALSKLDENMSAAYKNALQKYGQEELSRREQAQWIKDRNSCESKGCLKALYQARLQELSIEPAQFRAMPPTVLVDTSDKPVFDNEADKLKFMRYIATQHAFEPTKLTANEEFCQQFFEDFSKGGALEAVEPDVRASDANDPRLKKWHRCEDKEIAPDGFERLVFLGGPPYRYYQIDVDGNPENVKEDVIYTDYIKTPSGGIVGSNGYYWVDLGKCEAIGGGVTSLTPFHPYPPNVYHLNSIVKYKDSFLVVDLSPSGQPAYSLDVSPIGGGRERQFCLWHQPNK